MNSMRPGGRMGRQTRASLGRWSYLIVLLLAATAPAEEPAIVLEVSDREVFVGETTTLKILLNHFPAPQRPDLSSLSEACDVEYLGDRQVQFSSTTIINGMVQKTERRGVEYVFELTPRQPGPLSIGPIEAEADGETVKSETLRLDVRPIEPQDIAVVELTADRDEVYPSQPFRLRIDVHLRSVTSPAAGVPPLRLLRSMRASPPMLTIPWWEEGALPSGVEAQTSADEYLRQLRNEDGFGINEIRVRSAFSLFDASVGKFAPSPEKTERLGLDGEPAEYWSYRFEQVFVARNVGEYAFGPVKLRGVFVTGRNDARRWTGKSVFTLAPELTVRVKSPPAANRPPNYLGAVGRFRVSSTLTPTTAQAGDPLTLVIQLQGEGALDTAQALDLRRIDEITRSFKVYPPSEKLDEDGWQAIYSLRPLNEQVTEFPELQVAYFDVEAEQYVSHTLPAIPLDIAAADRLAGSDIATAPQPGLSEEDSPTDAEGWYRDVVDAADVRRQRGLTWAWTAAGVAAGGLLLAGVAAGLARGREARAARRLRRQAPARALQRLDEAEQLLQRDEVPAAARRLREAVTEVAAAVLRAETDDCTPRDLRSRLGPRVDDPTLAELAAELLETSDAARFGGEQASIRSALDKARHWCLAMKPRVKGGST